MSNSKFVNRLACFAGPMLMAAAFAASAHTTIRSQATESTTEDNALRIGHGCETPAGASIPVIAQSVVFPSDAPEVTTSDGSAVAGLQAVIEQGTLAGLARAIQDREHLPLAAAQARSARQFDRLQRNEWIAEPRPTRQGAVPVHESEIRRRTAAPGDCW